MQNIDFYAVMCYAFSGDFMFAEYLRTDEIVFKHALGCRDVFDKEFHVFNELFLLSFQTIYVYIIFIGGYSP